MTSSAVFVIPFREHLLKRLSGQRLVVRTEDPGEIVEVAGSPPPNLEAVILETTTPVTLLPFEEAWQKVPVLIRAPELGRVSRLLQHIPVIRKMSLRIMLPTEGENYVSLRILSSLGIPSGFLLKGETADWEKLLDLATYNFFNLVGHAPIAPYDVMGDHYRPGEPFLFGSAYLEDPGTRYFYLNREGELALSEEDLEEGKILYSSLEALAEAGMQVEPGETGHSLSSIFMSTGPCSVCPALKLCRGRLAGKEGQVPKGCKSFFSELMGLIEEYQALRDGRGC